MPTENHDAILYLTGATLSYAGTALVPDALSFAVLDTGHGAGALGLVLASQSVPTILLLLLGGVAGDRWPRHHVMIGADLLRTAAQALLAACLITGHAPLALMVLVAAVIGAGNAFFQPASGGFLTEITAPEQLGRMNGLLRTGNALAMVIGPALGGVIVAAIGPGYGIAVDAASYAASAACLLVIRPSMAAPSPARRSLTGELLEALRFIQQTRWLRLVLVQCAAINLLAFAPFNVIAPALLSQTPAGAGAWGTLLSGIGVGAVLGALACARRQPRRLLLGIQAAAVLLSAPMLLLALGAPLPAVVLGCVAFGIGAAMLSVLTITAIQRQVARPLLSRTMAVVQLANTGLNPLGYLLAGPAMSRLGAPASLGLSGFCVLATAAIMLSQGDIRRMKM